MVALKKKESGLNVCSSPSKLTEAGERNIIGSDVEEKFRHPG